jgi:hypothetical protein
LRRFSKTVAWLCLALMLGAACAEVTHQHADEAKSATCQICAVAHSSAPITTWSTAKPIFREQLTVRHEVRDAKYQVVAFVLYIRPPPVA